MCFRRKSRKFESVQVDSGQNRRSMISISQISMDLFDIRLKRTRTSEWNAPYLIWSAPIHRRFLLLKILSGVRKLTTFYLAKNDHRWVTFIYSKTINIRFSGEFCQPTRFSVEEYMCPKRNPFGLSIQRTEHKEGICRRSLASKCI